MTKSSQTWSFRTPVIRPLNRQRRPFKPQYPKVWQTPASRWENHGDSAFSSVKISAEGEMDARRRQTKGKCAGSFSYTWRRKFNSYVCLLIVIVSYLSLRAWYRLWNYLFIIDTSTFARTKEICAGSTRWTLKSLASDEINSFLLIFRMMMCTFNCWYDLELQLVILTIKIRFKTKENSVSSVICICQVSFFIVRVVYYCCCWHWHLNFSVSLLLLLLRDRFFR